MSAARQVLMRSTLVGPQELIAPGSWIFDGTAIEVWYWLVTETRRKEFKRQRDKFTCEAKIETLANVLANSIGMASTYWVLAARDIVKESIV